MSRFIRIVLLILLGLAAGLAFRPLINPGNIDVTPAEKVPLGASAVIRSRKPVSVTLTVAGLDGVDLTTRIPDLSRRHEIPVLGLYPDTVNRIEFVLTEENGRQHRHTVKIETEPLPEIFPDIIVERHLPDQVAPGMTFLQLAHYDDEGNYHPLPCAVDAFGRVRWFYDGDIGHVLKRLANGNLLINDKNNLFEIDMLGRHIADRGQAPTGIHHDAIELPDGNLLGLSSSPGSFEDGLIEFDRQSGRHTRYWDFRTILDPDRPLQPRNLEEKDWLHLNGLSYDATRGDIILSGRDQSAVFSVDRRSGELQWILGAHDHWKERFNPFLLKPVGEAFSWSWGQHAPMIDPTNPNRLLVYDNGNKRSYNEPLAPGDNYSRAVEYEIDTDTMEVRQLWEYGREYGPELYTPFIGDANYLTNGNRLVCFGGITRALDGQAMEIFDFEAGAINKMKISARIIEVTGDTPAREVQTIRIEDSDQTRYRGYRCYRAVRMTLYP